MANTKSAKKRTRKTIRQTAINKNCRNRVRTFIKKAGEALAQGDEAANSAFIKAEAEIMKSASKGIMSKKTAARKISRMAARLKAKAEN